MVDGTIPDTPTAHVSADIVADYPAVDGVATRGPTAHTNADIESTEPGP
jgi:hypothetical protein